MISPLVLVLAQISAATLGVRNPAWAPDGRLAVSIRGDIWVRTGDAWKQITSGPAWDRQPTWTPDGLAIVFASNQTGNGDLYRIAVNGDGVAERITTSQEPDAEPSVSADGSILFARGRRSQSQIWIRTPQGAERRFTRGTNGAEHWPAWSPDGQRVAYGAMREDRTRLRIRYVVGDSDRVVVEDRDAEHPAWSPSGDRIVFSTRN